MTLIHIIFYVFSAVAIGAGLMVVSSRNAVHSALFLVLAFVASSGLWILLHAEFLALILVLVYVGAVMTLFLFVVMMLSVNKVMTRESFVRYLPIGALVVVLMVGITFLAVGPAHMGLAIMPTPPMKPADFSDTAQLGSVLYTDYVFPFEVAGALLLTAIIASISLAHRIPKERKVQNISKQIAANPKDRVRLIKMPSSKRSQ